MILGLKKDKTPLDYTNNERLHAYFHAKSNM